MKYYIAIQEVLRKEFVVEADTYGDARDFLEKKYRDGEIVLMADDAVGESMSDTIFTVDGYSEEELEEMEVDYDIRE